MHSSLLMPGLLLYLTVPCKCFGAVDLSLYVSRSNVSERPQIHKYCWKSFLQYLERYHPLRNLLAYRHMVLVLPSSIFNSLSANPMQMVALMGNPSPITYCAWEWPIQTSSFQISVMFQDPFILAKSDCLLCLMRRSIVQLRILKVIRHFLLGSPMVRPNEPTFADRQLF